MLFNKTNKFNIHIFDLKKKKKELVKATETNKKVIFNNI